MTINIKGKKTYQLEHYGKNNVPLMTYSKIKLEMGVTHIPLL